MAHLRRLPVSLAAVLLAAGSVRAQDDCALLLQHGLYDTFHTANAAANSQDIRNHLCSDNSSAKASGTGVSANVDVPFQFSGGGTYNQTQSEAIRAAMCSDGSSITRDNSAVDVYSHIISPTAISAFSQCVALNKQGLHVRTLYDESGQGVVTISMNYSTDGSNPPQQVTGIDLNTPNDPDEKRKVKCAGPLAVAAQGSGGARLDGNVLTMTCSRGIVADPRNAFLVAGNRVLAAPSRITINTNVGAVVRDFSAIAAPEIVTESPVPIGGIIDWFALPGGTIPANFILCDGSVIPSGPMAGQKAPNLKGRVTVGTATVSEVGAIGGSDKATVEIPAHEHTLLVGSGSEALREDGGNGVINHTTGASLVKSRTNLEPAHKISIDTEPPYVMVFKIMRFK